MKCNYDLDMNIKYRLVLTLLIILILWKGFTYFDVLSKHREQIEVNKFENKEIVKVSVYYEALCSDSRNFMINQLIPTYEELSDHILLDFVPYGKAKTIEENGKISFTCQHGTTECFANKVHACVINILTEQKLQLKYISCMIYDNIIPLEALERCGKELGVDYNVIVDCINSKEADLLLKRYGIQTTSVTPRITFIPTLGFNGSADVKLAQVLKDFKGVLCNLYKAKPKACL